MHPQSINVNPTQLQQILQLQQLQRQQAQFQQQQQQNNRQQIQIFASPPNTNHVNNNNNAPNTSNAATLFQVNGAGNEENPANNNGHNTNTATNGIQFQPLQILQMAQGNNNNANSTPNNAVNSRNSTPISFTTGIPNFNANRIALIHQLRQRQQAQQQSITQQGLAAAMGQAHLNANHAQAAQQANGGGGGGANGNVNVGAANSGGQFRQSIQQQMVTFIQQLQQFPPLFQHLQNNPHVLAQLLQQFKWKQEQNARDMQQRLSLSNNMQVPLSQGNIANVGGLIRSFAARQLHNNNQSNMLNVAHTPIAIQPPNTSNNTGLLPALENEHSKSLDNQQNNNSHNKSADDVIILNDAELNEENNNNVNSANANNSNSSNISIPPLLNATGAAGAGAVSQLDFSQLKTMRIPMMIDGDENNGTQNAQQPQAPQVQTAALTQSPLKRPFSSVKNTVMKVADKSNSNSHSAESPPMKRRRLNHEKATITISSDDTSMNMKERDRERKKKKRRKREKKKEKEKERTGYTTRSSSKRKEREEIVSLLSDGGGTGVHVQSGYKSFGEMVSGDLGVGGGEDVILGDRDDFMNDPLISEIANKMYEIRQISATQRMATPERSGNINAGLDVLLQAIDEMDQQKIRVSKRKNGELFVVGGERKSEPDNISKIREILGLDYSFFKLNAASTIIKSLASSNDVAFKNKLTLLCGEFSEHYDGGLLQVFKTCTDAKFKNQFLSCGGDVASYFSHWDVVVKMNLMAPMDHWLRNYRIKEVVGLMFAIMDHLFSYKLYTYLCNIKDANMNQNDNNKQHQTEKKLESEEWICTTGNMLFASMEKDATKLRAMETTNIEWLFPYWKSVLLQAQEPIKCLCRSYLMNSAPNPWKMRLYAMIKQTAHCPQNTLLSPPRKGNRKSKSMSPHHTSNNKVDRNRKSKTPPHNNHNKHSHSHNHHHFMRANTSQSMSINAFQKSNKNKTKHNIPSSSVCGKTFVNALECAEHAKQCKECKHRIVSIASDV